MESLTIALSKGRILDETLPLLAAANVVPLEDPNKSRRLILPTNRPEIKLIVVRASDVPTYVTYGAADLGVAGKDVLMEYGSDELYEPLDLKIGQCRMMTAGRPEISSLSGRLRVATKYANCARRYFSAQGRQVEIIKLYGSMELAPLVGLADVIVDLVDTGNTLKANGLAPMELIAPISSRLIVNKAAMKTKHSQIQVFIAALRTVVDGISFRARVQAP